MMELGGSGVGPERNQRGLGQLTASTQSNSLPPYGTFNFQMGGRYKVKSEHYILVGGDSMK